MFGNNKGDDGKRLDPKAALMANLMGDDAILGQLSRMIAEQEHHTLLEVRRLCAAADVEEPAVPAVDLRQQELSAFARAQVEGDLRGYWTDAVLAKNLTNPESAAAYLGIDRDDWDAQIERWADEYRNKSSDGLEEMSDREIATEHVRKSFAVGMDEFEREVVDWTKKDAVGDALAGNWRIARERIAAVTATLEPEETEE